MSINYHEMTMQESKNSPERKRQFLVISVVGFGVILASIVSAGLFVPVILSEGEFPGGEFRFRSRAKDYSASMGLFREVAKTLRVSGPNGQWGDLIYGIYHDDANIVQAKTRFSVGALLDSDMKEKYDPLFQRVGRQKAYDTAVLPKVPAIVTHFPFTNGFISALIFQFKVLPAMYDRVRSLAGENEQSIVVSTCSIQEKMCTHFAPLKSSEDFMLGKTPTAEYAEKMALKNKQENEKKALKAGSILKGFKKLVGMKDEL